VDESGHYSGFLEPPGYRAYELTFRNDRIFMNYIIGGNGGGTTSNIKGKK
jgi:hypothetical protein